MFKKIAKMFKKVTHRCSPIIFLETGEVIEFYWDVPWTWSQTFQVCTHCGKVKVLSEIKNDNRGRYRKETDGKIWSGSCSFAKVPSFNGSLEINHLELQSKYKIKHSPEV